MSSRYDALRNYIASVHEMTVHGNRSTACLGRFLGELTPIIIDFIDEERGRKSEDAQISCALALASITLISVAAEFASAGEKVDVAKQLLDHIRDEVVEIVEKAEEV